MSYLNDKDSGEHHKAAKGYPLKDHVLVQVQCSDWNDNSSNDEEAHRNDTPTTTAPYDCPTRCPRGLGNGFDQGGWEGSVVNAIGHTQDVMQAVVHDLQYQCDGMSTIVGHGKKLFQKHLETWETRK